MICRSLDLPLSDANFLNVQSVSNFQKHDLILKRPWYYSNGVYCKGTESSLVSFQNISQETTAHILKMSMFSVPHIEVIYNNKTNLFY